MTLGLGIDLASVVLTLAFTVVIVRRHPPAPLWPSFLFVTVSLAVWSIGETCAQFLSSTDEGHRFWVGVLYTGAIALPPSWLYFMLAFSRHVGVPLRWDVPTLRRASIVVAIGLWMSLATLSWHGLFITPHREGHNEYHLLWYVHAGVAYLVLLGSVPLCVHLRTRVRAPALRKQIWLVLAGVSAPLLANLAFLTGVSPGELDPTVPAISVATLLFFLAIYRSRYFALTPFSLQNLLESEEDVWLILDPQGTVVAYSRGAVSFFEPERLHPNCDGLELLRATLLFPGRDRRLDRREIEEEIFGRSLSANVLRDAPSGEPRALRLATTVVRSSRGRVRGVGVRLRDITVEARLRESQRLESLGVLAGGIAHDFNNLLAVVSGHAELVLRRPETAAANRRSAEIICEVARQAADLTDQMLNYAGRGQIEEEILSVAQLVGETAGVVRHGVSKDTNLSVNVRDRPLIAGDASQIRQVLMNLIQNGAESLPNGIGSIAVSVRVAQVREDQGIEFVGGERLPPGRYAIVEVADTGIGIEPANLARIFDPFYTSKFTGRGLGLASVLGIIRRHRGALHVRSTVGRGSTFTVFLPSPEGALGVIRSGSSPMASSPVAGAEASPATAIGRSAHGGTVLVADDERAVRELVEQILREEGFHVVAAAGGREAISLYEDNAHVFDLVLLDLTMPEVGGEAVLARIKEIDPQQPVAVMSGYTESKVANRLTGLGSSAILAKPFRRAELLKALRCAGAVSSRR